MGSSKTRPGSAARAPASNQSRPASTPRRGQCSRLGAPWRLLLATLAGGVLAGCGGPTEPTESHEGELSGTLEVIAVDGPGAEGGTRYYLRRHDGDGVLPLVFGRAPTARAGQPLRVIGTLENEALRVTHYEVDDDWSGDLGRAAEKLLEPTSIRQRSTAVVLVDVGGGINRSADFFDDYMYSTGNPGPLMGFDSDDRSVVEYYDETSHGAYEMTGAVEGPESWSGEACADYGRELANTISDRLSTEYDSTIWYYGSEIPNCGYGWGSQGTWDRPQGNVWFNGGVFPTAIPHEMGHNLGLLHASSIDCGDVPLADNPLTCSTEEYGNPISIMGNLGVGHMMGIEKWYFGWFGGCNGVRVRTSGTFTLLPIEVPCDGIQTLQIPMPVNTRTFDTEQSAEINYARYYYLELRQTVSLDSDIAQGVYVHASDEISPSNDYSKRSVVLDMNPSTNRIDGMQLGESYTDPAGGVSFRVDALDNDHATVTVSLDSSTGSSECMDGTLLEGSGPDNCQGESTGTGGSPGVGGTTGSGGTGTGGSDLGSGGTGTGGDPGSGGSGVDGASGGSGGAGVGGSVLGSGGAGVGGAMVGSGGAGVGGSVLGSGGAGVGGTVFGSGGAGVGGDTPGVGGAPIGTGGALVGGGGAGVGGAMIGTGGLGVGGTIAGVGGALVGSGGALLGLGGVATGGSTIGPMTGGQYGIAPLRGAPGEMTEEGESEQPGCSCNVPGESHDGATRAPWSLLAALGLLLVRRRRLA